MSTSASKPPARVEELARLRRELLRFIAASEARRQAARLASRVAAQNSRG
jgi:hypothetical protein